MKVSPVIPPRTFVVGVSDVELRHVADVELEADEMVTFVTAEGRELDFTRKSWGYYPLPSLNGRLRAHGFRTALTRNEAGKVFVNVVQEDSLGDFDAYLRAENGTLIEWLDARE